MHPDSDATLTWAGRFDITDCSCEVPEWPPTLVLSCRTAYRPITAHLHTDEARTQWTLCPGDDGDSGLTADEEEVALEAANLMSVTATANLLGEQFLQQQLAHVESMLGSLEEHIRTAREDKRFMECLLAVIQLQDEPEVQQVAEELRGSWPSSANDLVAAARILVPDSVTASS